jgi:formylglycine-generating enzyme required for sulfatase activity
MIVVCSCSGDNRHLQPDGDADGDGDGDALWLTVPAGSFTMGAPPDEAGRRDDELAHVVTLTRPFEMLRHEVTQDEFETVMGYNPSIVVCPQCPVDRVNWHEAAAYCNELSAFAGDEQCYSCNSADAGDDVRCAPATATPYDCAGYRLPTEAEWEYAARAGELGARYGPVDDIAWWEGNSGYNSHEVEQLLPNAWGFYDMLGNIGEATAGFYGPYAPEAVTDPSGASEGTIRVYRGGFPGTPAELVRFAVRIRFDQPNEPDLALGFRPCRTLTP